MYMQKVQADDLHIKTECVSTLGKGVHTIHAWRREAVALKAIFVAEAEAVKACSLSTSRAEEEAATMPARVWER